MGRLLPRLRQQRQARHLSSPTATRITFVGWESLLLENRGDGTFTDAAAKGGAYFTTQGSAPRKARWRITTTTPHGHHLTTMGDRLVLLHNRDKSGNH